MSKFEISKRKNGEYQFNLKSSNGEVILTSESYAAKISCKSGIESVKRNSQQEEMYEKRTSKDGHYYFNLKAANGQIIGTSEMYNNSASRDSGIASVKRNAPEAIIIDLSNQ